MMGQTIRATLKNSTQASLLRLKAAAVEVLGEVNNSDLVELLILSATPSRLRAYLENRRAAPASDSLGAKTS